MTTGLTKISITANKLYRQCISKPKAHPDYTRYVKYRNMYNKLKHIAKTNHYAHNLNAFNNDSKMEFTKTMIGKNNDKSGIPLHSKMIII